MYQDKLNFTPDDILEKEFKIDTRGYRLKEVDHFLDLIISDYGVFLEIINKQEREKYELADEKSKVEISELGELEFGDNLLTIKVIAEDGTIENKKEKKMNLQMKY